MKYYALLFNIVFFCSRLYAADFIEIKSAYIIQEEDTSSDILTEPIVPQRKFSPVSNKIEVPMDHIIEISSNVHEDNGGMIRLIHLENDPPVPPRKNIIQYAKYIDIPEIEEEKVKDIKNELVPWAIQGLVDQIGAERAAKLKEEKYKLFAAAVAGITSAVSVMAPLILTTVTGCEDSSSIG